MIEVIRRFTESKAFHAFIIVCILANAAILGVEVSGNLSGNTARFVAAANFAFRIVFLAEIILRLLACHPNYRRFFRDGWNVFDFVVVLLTTLPLGGSFANVSRLLRLLRVIRLVSVSPELKLIVGTMFKSIPSMGHVILLLSLLLYVYAVAGVHLFGQIDAENWGTLGRALLSLFQVVTVEGWPEFQSRVLPAMPLAWMYFASFIVIAVFVVINLFIAVVINNLEKVHSEEQLKADSANPDRDLLARLEKIKDEIDSLERLVRRGREAQKESGAS